MEQLRWILHPPVSSLGLPRDLTDECEGGRGSDRSEILTLFPIFFPLVVYLSVAEAHVEWKQFVSILALQELSRLHH